MFNTSGKFKISALFFIQDVLSLKHEGDSKLIMLRKKGESISAYKETKRHSFEQSQRELEEDWTRILQTALEMKIQTEHEDSLSSEIKSFQDHLGSTQAWIRKLKVTLQCMDKVSPAEEIITHAQVQFNICSIFCIVHHCILFTCLKIYANDLCMKQSV